MFVVIDVFSVGLGLVLVMLQQVMVDIMGCLGKVVWLGIDCVVIDVVIGYVGVGYYVGMVIIGWDVMNVILFSYGVGCYQDVDGVF